MSDALDAYIYCMMGLRGVNCRHQERMYTPRKEDNKMKYFTKLNNELLARLEKETNVLWSDGDLPTKLDFKGVDKYVSFDKCEFNSIAYAPKEFHEGLSYLELTNESFIKYVKSVVGERKKQKTIYDLKVGDKYFKVMARGEVSFDHWLDNNYDAQHLSVGNVYLTREDAEKALAKLKATAKVKKRIVELNDGWIPDWRDITQTKHYVEYLFVDKKLDHNYVYQIKTHDNDLYLKTNELAQQLIEEMPNELKTMLEVE